MAGTLPVVAQGASRLCDDAAAICHIASTAVKFTPRTGHEGLSLTSALDGVGSHRNAPAALPPEETGTPLYRRLGGPQGRSGRLQETTPPPPGIRSPDRPTRRESLYRLRYPSPPYCVIYSHFPYLLRLPPPPAISISCLTVTSRSERSVCTSRTNTI
jgi:hypothetical protein